MTTLCARVERATARRGAVTFVGPGGGRQRVPWVELHEDARAMAAALQALGLGRGARVALLGPTTRPLVTAIQAVWLAGATVVVLPLPMRPASFAELVARTRTRLRDVDAAAVVVDPGLVAFVERAAGDPPVVPLGDLRPGPGRPTAGCFRPPPVDPADLAAIQFTSGSTAEPKGVMLPHATVVANLDAVAEGAALDPDGDVLVSWLPLYHDMGLIGLLTLAMVTGTDLVLGTAQEFMAAPATWMEWMSDHGGTATAGPNFSYALAARALGRVGGLDLSRWRVALNGAEPVDPATVEAFVAAAAPHRFDPGAVFPAFGLAEVAIGATFPELGRGLVTDAVDRRAMETDGYAAPAPAPAPASGAVAASVSAPGSAVAAAGGGAGGGVRRLARLGRPLAGLELRVCDPDGGRVLGEREVGELEIRGSSLTPGYYNRPEATAAAFHDGWLRTGDLAYLVEGELVVCGRLGDVIVVDGRTLSPEEVERAVAGVEGVRAGNVIAFGVARGGGGEAVVVVAETRVERPASLREAVAARVRAVLGAAPGDVVVVAPGTLPKTSSGKLQRSLCRRRYLDGDLTGL